MFRKSFIISVLVLFSFLFYSCNQSGQDTKNEIKTKNQFKLANSSDAFLGKRYVYSLGCAWDSQTIVKGFLHFYSSTQFRLNISQGIKKLNIPEGEIYDLETYKEEIFEGEYELIPDSKAVKLKLLSSKIKIQERNQNDKEEKREFINRSFIAKIDSCDKKSTLILTEETEGIPNEKYYQWVEQNYSGKYISYAEGLKEEITISDEKNKLRMYYQSASYQKSIELVIKKYEVGTDEVEANFPNDKEKNYSFSLSYNSLSTFTKDNHNQWQQFFKITQEQWNSNNLKDLAFKDGNYYSTIFFGTKDKGVYDTIILLQNNQKAKIKKVNKNYFIKSYKSSFYEKMSNKICSKLKLKTDDDKCSKLVEKAVLKEDKIVKREGEILIFPLKNQQNYFLRDILDFGAQTQRFTYQGSFNSITGKVFITYGSYWESQNYHLVHQNSGEEILISNHPYLSPSGRYMIGANNLGLNYFMGTSIQLWEITKNGFDLVGEFSSLAYTPLKFTWINDSQVLFEAIQKVSTDGQNHTMTYGEISFGK